MTCFWFSFLVPFIPFIQPFHVIISAYISLYASGVVCAGSNVTDKNMVGLELDTKKRDRASF